MMEPSRAVLWRKRHKNFSLPKPTSQGMNEKGNRYALAALKDKRATIAGEILSLQRKINAREQQLRHVDATIQVFEPGFDADSIPAKRPQKHVNLFRSGQLSQLILDGLRRAGEPVTTAQLTTLIREKLGHSEETQSILHKRVRGNLAYHERVTGNVVKIGEGREARWRLA